MCDLEKTGTEYKIFPMVNRYASKIDYEIPIGGANYTRYQRGGY